MHILDLTPPPGPHGGSLEEHVLKELSISIDIFMFFSSFEVIVLILGGKVMTFVLYPLLRSEGIVKN